MKALPLISVVSSLFLGILATSAAAASGGTNDLACAPAPVSEPTLSRSSLQILQLTQAGMDESVIVYYISNSGTFHLSANQIVYLNDLGVSSHVIQAMLAHDREKLAASSQSTNIPNGAVAVRHHAALAAPVEQPGVRSFAQENLQADAKSRPVIPATGKLTREDAAAARKTTTQAVPQPKKVFYPVREPYPVELTAPIVFLDPPTF